MDQPVKAGFWQRIKLSFNQSKDTVVYRTADGVWLQNLDRGVLRQPEYKNFEHLQYYAVLSAQVYGETTQSSDVKIPLDCKLIADETSVATLTQKGKTVSGLRFQVWYWSSEKQLIIAFRGTGKRLGDWFSNFRWVTRFIPGVHDHYDMVRDNIESILSQVIALAGPVSQIITTGHSLGGGLAQQAAYGSKNIKTVYAFNPTPITGYRNIDKPTLRENRKGIFIARIFEHGEILAYMRFGLRMFYKISGKNPEIVELRFNFSRKPGVIREHAMDALAQQVWKASAEPSL
jgi:hypothetical protein